MNDMDTQKTIRSNYDKFPAVKVAPAFGECLTGWDSITSTLNHSMQVLRGSKAQTDSQYTATCLVVECYNGVNDREVREVLKCRIEHSLWIDTADVMLPPAEIDAFFRADITDDELFGYLTRYHIDAYFDPVKVASAQERIASAEGSVVIYGVGAAYVAPHIDLLVYADMARWEIQMRYRRGEVGNIGADNAHERASLKYKRGFFVDWRICDRWKKILMPRWDYLLDTNQAGQPKMCTGEAVRATLAATARRPFRVVPFFDPGPWGGQWMKEVCDLDRSEQNFAWCFDCVPEENSLLLAFPNATIEIPSIDLVFAQPRALLGDPVHGRFGDEFPIRFDFLDTMQGGNLSLQVHPLTEYIQEKFGMHYTQDESYYLLDAKEDACVYLGLKNGVDPQAMLDELRAAQQSGHFDAERHVGVYPVKKHDHVLIPAGTIHCSGANSMVLEISATPFIFTFKLWDWGRLGLDGRPRPINIAHGANVIQWERTEDWVRGNLLNRVRPIASGEGWRTERTGLHEREFIETERTWFTGKAPMHTGGGVNVLNLVEGREAIVESPDGSFEPMVVHYAETFIIPAAVGAYTIRPYGEAEGTECGVIKAFVRFNV